MLRELRCKRKQLLTMQKKGYTDAIMYAAPIEIDGKLYVFYNGNNFGRDGFAAAVLEAE